MDKTFHIADIQSLQQAIFIHKKHKNDISKVLTSPSTGHLTNYLTIRCRLLLCFIVNFRNFHETSSDKKVVGIVIIFSRLQINIFQISALEPILG